MAKRDRPSKPSNAAANPRRRPPKPSMRLKDGRKQPFVWFPSVLMRDYGAAMKPHGIAVYMALLTHANKEATSWPTHHTMAVMTGMSLAQVKVSLNTLHRLGLIAITMRRPKASIYTLLDVPERQPNSQVVAITPEAPNSQVVAINSQVVAINSQVVAIEQPGGSYEVDVLEVEPLNQNHPTTPPPTPSPHVEASQAVVGEVVDKTVAIAHTAEATANGHDATREAWVGGDARFASFWEVYPHHRRKAKARAIWEAHHLDDSLPAILAALAWQTTLTGHDAPPYCADVYLANEGWKDAPPAILAALAWDRKGPEPADGCKSPACDGAPGRLSDKYCDGCVEQRIDVEAAAVLHHFERRHLSTNDFERELANLVMVDHGESPVSAAITAHLLSLSAPARQGLSVTDIASAIVEIVAAHREGRA